MITKNFKTLMSTILQSCGINKGILPIKDVTGTTYYANESITRFPYTVTVSATLSSNSAGIRIGSGTAAPTEEDYNLGTMITSGASVTVTNTETDVDEDGNPYVSFTLTVRNTGSQAIVISEIGYVQQINGSSAKGAYASTAVMCLLDRTLLDSLITIESGATVTIGYVLKTIL